MAFKQSLKDVLNTFKKLRGVLVPWTEHLWPGCPRTRRDEFVCLCDCFFSLKLECEKLASEKTEMQRHYVMVSPKSPPWSLSLPPREAVEFSTGEHSLERYTLFWMFFCFLGIQAWRQPPVKTVQFPI